MIPLVIGVVLSYLLGSIPFAYLLGRGVKGIDIRQHGSGNVGAANVFRVVGKKWGLLVLVLDLVKGFFVVSCVAPLFYGLAVPLPRDIFRFLLGFAAISGHNWTIFLHFRGGKGVATSAGVFLGLLPQAALAALLVWLLLVFAFRYVSVASMGGALSFPFWVYIFYQGHPQGKFFLVVSCLLALLTFFMHRSNIRRLLEGKESRAF